MASRLESIDAYLAEAAQLLATLDRAAIERAAAVFIDCYRSGRRVYTAGNGGSASTAQHFACDLATYVVPPDARPFDVRCLTDNIPLYTAWANDADRDDVFVNQLHGLLVQGDVVLAISVHGGSGYSADIVRLVRYAKAAGAHTISLVGFDGGPLHQESSCSILVPVASTPHAEGIHLVVEHLLMHLIREELA